MIALVLGLAVAGIGYFFFGKKGANSETTTKEQTTTDSKTDVADNNHETTKTDNAGDKAPADRGTFDYTPPKPQNGVLKGGSRSGCIGALIVSLSMWTRTKTGELKKADFGKSMMYEKMTTPLEIKEGLKNYIGAMSDYGVLPHNIHFVVSSGAQQTDICQK